ncbi:threonine aldolase family protein [Halapricum desulfuricans]|uniref:Selenocysteine lyase/Cysteine desulfurase n=1 Tax=Halapricum desulfuricans TaxID=2841257 RepID=A0A897NSL7_9EURY|nr:GntG family PLP-dependent aldolase [Halapricum desulfuricans]QSG14475.1 Selenocysteine lyase/Cysteine desulfurase [Halapricum desulfuricans]
MIDLRSDTVTTPSDAMRAAAADADVGDDVYGEDPTVNELQSRAADLLGKEAALYVPSGTMGNQIAVRTHTERGQEVLLEEACHTYKWELGGIAQHSQVQARTLDGGERGVIAPEQVRNGYVQADDHRPGTGLLVLENTHNAKGGTAIAPEHIDAAAEAAHERGVPVHLDGARLFNAAAALDVPAARIAREADSVMSCLSKGLGAPIGSMLAGSSDFIERARRVRKLMGGGMRQAGIVAAPGLLALENRDRLQEDHRRARELAAGLDDVEGMTVPQPETNIVLVETDEPAREVLDRLGERDVMGSAFGEHTIRLCTHWDIDDEDIETTVERARGV